MRIGSKGRAGEGESGLRGCMSQYGYEAVRQIREESSFSAASIFKYGKRLRETLSFNLSAFLFILSFTFGAV